MPFADLAAAQAAVDAWVDEYNTVRPHQAIGIAAPASRFSTARARTEQELLPLRLPSVLALAPDPPLPPDPPAQPAPGPVPVPDSRQGTTPAGPPVEFDRVVPPAATWKSWAGSSGSAWRAPGSRSGSGPAPT